MGNLIPKARQLGPKENISVDEYYNILANKLFPFPKNPNYKIVLPIKIFISNVTPAMTNIAEALRSFKSDSLLFGPAHAGIQFGGVVVDWNQSSLVHIGELKYSTATVLFEIHDAVQVVYTPDLEQKAVAFIRKWDTTKMYSYGTWNCHRFVKDFLEEVLSLSLNQCFKGALGEYIQQVITKGDPTPRLKLSNHENRELVFKSHADLEVAENERWEEERNNVPLAERKWNFTKEELKLMKVFHRGFQLQEAAREESFDCFHGKLTTGLEILNDHEGPAVKIVPETQGKVEAEVTIVTPTSEEKRASIHQRNDQLRANKNDLSQNNNTNQILSNQGEEQFHIEFSELEVGKQIGEGSFGIVYKAKLKDQKCAVKCFKLDDLEDRQKLITKEIEALKSLKHKCIVRLIGITNNPTKGTLLVMEYMEDGSLEKLLKNSNEELWWEHAIQIALDVARGLQYLHSQKIIHRDLKSANVLLYNNRRNAKLSDFGTARVFDNSCKGTTAVGTFGFMAPEVVHGRDYNTKADIYSFGALLHNMLTRKRFPILFQNDAAAIAKVESNVSDIDFQKLIIQCCKTNPDQRPTIEDCIYTLEAIKHTHLLPSEKLSLEKRKVLEAKIAVLKEYDPKTNKKIEDFFDPAKLCQQLFDFNKNANEIRLGVHIFLSSASPFLATNAKLLRHPKMSSSFGFTHAGLHVGNVFIEWNQSGLVCIGNLRHSLTAITFDACDAIKVTYTKDLEGKIISFIQKWNTSYNYSPSKYNCHQFVSDFLQQTLSLSLMRYFEGPLGRYIEYAKQHGNSTPRLFSKHYGEIVFNSHEELEEIEKELKRNLSDADKKWHKLTKEEINLMQVFHRVFQLQEIAAGKDRSCFYGIIEVIEVCNDNRINFDAVFYSPI